MLLIAVLALVAFIAAAVLGLIRKDHVAVALAVGLGLMVVLIHPFSLNG